VYYILMVLAFIMFVASFLLKRNRPEKGAAVATH
jgi:hypothetical protein